MTTTITITWSAFSKYTNEQPTSATIAIPHNLENREGVDKQLCDVLFHQTNTYEGDVWNLIEPLLPSNRTHTALSVGDEITITNNNVTRTYRCDDFGWELLSSQLVNS